MSSRKYINSLRGQRALLIGGTSGIGFCVAENILENGGIVIVASSKQASVDKTISRLTTSYPDLTANISGHTIDLNAADVETKILGLLDVATNNGAAPLDHIIITAGGLPVLGPIGEADPIAALKDVEKIRIFAPLLFAKHAPGKYLRISNKSSFTHTSGQGPPQKGHVMLGLLRGSAQGMTQCLAVDLAPIRVNLVLPSGTDTELLAAHIPPEQAEQFKQKTGAQMLTGIIAQPEEVSEVYLYIMRNSNVTGQTLTSDGGIMIAPTNH